jgi:hypothetical protein
LFLFLWDRFFKPCILLSIFMDMGFEFALLIWDLGPAYIE